MQMLPTHIVTADQLTDGLYTGSVDLTAFNGHIEIAAGLGWVRFSGHVAAAGRIRALAGSGIEAGEGIKAGSGIEAGEGIKAGWGIKAGEGIKAGLGIEAGSGIEAGLGIEAGSGIEAGFSIAAPWVSAALRIFVGLCLWREPTPDEMQLRAELRGGVLAFGEHVPPITPLTEPDADAPLTGAEIAAVRALLKQAA